MSDIDENSSNICEFSLIAIVYLRNFAEEIRQNNKKYTLYLQQAYEVLLSFSEIQNVLYTKYFINYWR